MWRFATWFSRRRRRLGRLGRVLQAALMGGWSQAAQDKGRGGGTSCWIWNEELGEAQGRPCGGGCGWVVVDLAGEGLVAAALGGGGGRGEG
jgi:hypothetical protein